MRKFTVTQANTFLIAWFVNIHTMTGLCTSLYLNCIDDTQRAFNLFSIFFLGFVDKTDKMYRIVFALYIEHERHDNYMIHLCQPFKWRRVSAAYLYIQIFKFRWLLMVYIWYQLWSIRWLNMASEHLNFAEIPLYVNSLRSKDIYIFFSELGQYCVR